MRQFRPGRFCFVLATAPLFFSEKLDGFGSKGTPLCFPLSREELGVYNAQRIVGECYDKYFNNQEKLGRY